MNRYQGRYRVMTTKGYAMTPEKPLQAEAIVYDTMMNARVVARFVRDYGPATRKPASEYVGQQARAVRDELNRMDAAYAQDWLNRVDAMRGA